MRETPLNLSLRGTAGQSLGAWNLAGLNIHLVGDANDYVGKGMAGGRIVIHPPTERDCDHQLRSSAGETPARQRDLGRSPRLRPLAQRRPAH